jgi:hypothetical protein
VFGYHEVSHVHVCAVVGLRGELDLTDAAT